MTRPLGITLGDPAGIGPEVTVKALAEPRLGRVPAVVLGDVELLRETARRLRARVAVTPLAEEALVAGALPPRLRAGRRVVPVVPIAALGAAARRPGKPSVAGGRAAYRCIEAAARLAGSGAIAGIVTAPINKEWVNRAGLPISGHTELLKELTGAAAVRMMLAGRRLRVILVTMHVALGRVPRALSIDAVARTITIGAAHLRRYHRLARPRLAVAGLNPHAGEGGLFGNEEDRIIAPAIAQARRSGIDASGPYPADSLFFQAVDGKRFDAVIAMYHDQGLIPLKLLHFHDGVNVTLGLPVIRTSPDHGTAYDIAGAGTADAGSMLAAIALAHAMSRAGAPRL
ncbi:MAG: 4-hydroxythreonine-4-phosphate dehydrogenase PdxA [Deltaproteobacteria bacterium]|nr:4-hydroxythreonine-4-phosphate dehydrogenase PdxA [Deltaproteobacteria bacterium]